jgi:hypothetical protein
VPYIIDVKTPRATARTAGGRAVENHERRAAAGKLDYDVVSSVAVYDLDGARRMAGEEVVQASYRASDFDSPTWGTVEQTCYDLPESGGIIGPMPDGYVIDVGYVDKRTLIAIAGLVGPSWRAASVADIIDAYNAAQTV